MALTMTLDQSRPERISRNRSSITGTLAFDSSYAAGGESTDGSSLPSGYFLGSVLDIKCNPTKGYTFEYDSTNQKIKVFKPAPPIVYEEQQTVSSNAITLNYPAAYIMAISMASATVTPTGSAATLGATTNCNFTVADGTRTTITFGSGVSGTVYVTYITQAWREVYELIKTETLTGAAAEADKTGWTLASAPCAIQYIYAIGSAASAYNAPMLGSDDAGPASGEVEINWEDGVLTTLNTDSIHTIYVSYIAKPSSGLIKDRFVVSETAATFGNTRTCQAFDYPCLIWSSANQCSIIDQTNHYFISRGGTIGAGEAKFWGNWSEIMAPALGTGHERGGTVVEVYGKSDAATACAYVAGTWDEVPTVPLEVPNGENLSGLSSVRFEATGYTSA